MLPGFTQFYWVSILLNKITEFCCCFQRQDAISDTFPSVFFFFFFFFWCELPVLAIGERHEMAKKREENQTKQKKNKKRATGTQHRHSENGRKRMRAPPPASRLSRYAPTLVSSASGRRRTLGAGHSSSFRGSPSPLSKIKSIFHYFFHRLLRPSNSKKEEHPMKSIIKLIDVEFGEFFFLPDSIRFRTFDEHLPSLIEFVSFIEGITGFYLVFPETHFR